MACSGLEREETRVRKTCSGNVGEVALCSLSISRRFFLFFPVDALCVWEGGIELLVTVKWDTKRCGNVKEGCLGFHCCRHVLL